MILTANLDFFGTSKMTVTKSQNRLRSFGAEIRAEVPARRNSSKYVTRLKSIVTPYKICAAKYELNFRRTGNSLTISGQVSANFFVESIYSLDFVSPIAVFFWIKSISIALSSLFHFWLPRLDIFRIEVQKYGYEVRNVKE